MLDTVITQNDIYYHDYAYLKKLGDCYKLVKCNEVRRSGFQHCGTHDIRDGVWVGDIRHGKFFSRTSTYLDMSMSANENANMRVHSNDEKLKNNITRARNKIIEYGLCNDFDYFCTLTLDQEKYDRYDLPAFISSLGAFIQNTNARTSANIKYLLIPEQHRDGAWHLHGFLKGLPQHMLKLFDRKGKKKLPPFIVDGLKRGRKLYDFPAYSKRFGYCCLEPVESKIGSTMYMCKYINKDISSNVRELGAHLYYCSKGLKKAEVVCQGQWLDCDFDWNYVHKFGSISFYESLDVATLEYIKDRIGGEPVTLGDMQRGYKKDASGWMHYYDPDTGEIFADMTELYEMDAVFDGQCSEEELKRLGVITNVEFLNKSVSVHGKPVSAHEKQPVPAEAVTGYVQLRLDLERG